jgi:serine protease AprX
MKIFVVIEVFLLSFLSIGLSPDNSWQEKIEAELMRDLQAGGASEFLIILESQEDLHEAQKLQTKEAKGLYVVEHLERAARRTQPALLRILDQYGAPHRSFYIVNAIWSRGPLDLVRRLAQRPEVRGIQSNPAYTFHRPFPAEEEVRRRDGIEWGIRRIQADRVWEMGIRGEGVVVAGADTGYDWEHPALSSQYRGREGGIVDHNYNWHDAIHQISPIHQDSIITPDLNPCGLDSRVPCDDHGHGTHTMGTMVGDDGLGNQIGVAPKARWIACRNMERGFGSPATYIECFEWFLAPTDLDGNNPDPGRAPHVISNSWGCPPFEGCNPGNFAVMEQAVASLRAAGIVVVASAGNSGRRCSSVEDPAAIFADVFSVGASGRDDTIAFFSSRGPVAVDSSFRLKPNVAAPGIAVRSALPDSSFATWSGTSMAGPHVAGVVALMISANPGLAGQVDLIEDILEQTAKPIADTVACGDIDAGVVPNNTYGYGRIDALAAVQRALELTDVSPPIPSGRVWLFPNPARESIQLRLKDIRGHCRLTLFNAAGQLVLQTQWDNRKDQERTLPLPSLPQGIYLYQLIAATGRYQGKLIIQ